MEIISNPKDMQTKMNLFVQLLAIGIVYQLGSCTGQSTTNDFEYSQNATHIWQDTIGFDKVRIEDNFLLVSIDDIKMKRISIYGDYVHDIPKDILSSIFLLPVNEIDYSKSYIPNTFKSFYRFKVSDSVWLLAIHHHYDLHDQETIWNLYNTNMSQVTSKLIVEGFCMSVQRELKYFDGKKISIYTKYNRHFENGLEGDNSEPIEFRTDYIITDNSFEIVK